MRSFLVNPMCLGSTFVFLVSEFHPMAVSALQSSFLGRRVRGSTGHSSCALYAVSKKASKPKTKRKSSGTKDEKRAAASLATETENNSFSGVDILSVEDMPNNPVYKSSPLSEQDLLWEGPSVVAPDILTFDVTGGRPGAIIESEEDLARKEEIFLEIESGDRVLPDWMSEYGYLEEELEAAYDNDDIDAIDASTLGRYDITDLQSKFEHEWDPMTETDPNIIKDTTGFIQETEKDDEGVEVGYDPMFGPSNPMDTRTKTGVMDSFMIDDMTRDDSMLTPEFLPGDPEIKENEDFVKFRKSLGIIETYVDKFLPDMQIPRHVAKWHGSPEPMKYPPKPYINNRYTEKDKFTNFDAMDPYRARTRAVELARANNAEWLPDGLSQAWHQEQRRPYEEIGTLVGSLTKGECDPATVELIEPALKILGSCVDLLSIEQGTVFRFHYHGLMKHKYGMACWTETLIRDCGVEVTGVVFETGFRARDRAYDGGDPYYGYK